MARVNHKLVKQRLNEKRSKITDRQFFTSRLFAGHLEDLAAAQTRRYHYNRRVRVNIYWNSKDSFFAATDNMSVKINAGHPFITKTKGRENRYQIILGVFAHELGHILYTDFLAQQTHYNYLGSYKWYPYPPVLTTSADARREKTFWEYVKEDAKNLEMAQYISQYISNLIDDGYVEDRSYAPYGYLKDENDKNKLVVDPEIAPIVIEIFELRAQGIGIEALCRVLNEKGYPSPGRLRYERGIITNNNKKGSALLWNRHVLKDLLLNIAYIGNLAQGRSAQCLYKGQKFHRTDSSEWDVVYGTHPAIIGMDLWEKVQEINNRQTAAAKESHGKYSHLPKRINPYGSIIKCGNCGRVLKYVRSYSRPRKDGLVKDYYNYKCPQNIELGDAACPKKNIKADELDALILDVIKKQMDLFLDTKKTLSQLIAIEKERSKRNAPIMRVVELKEQLETKKKAFSSLYFDYKEGILTQREYMDARENYQSMIASLEQQIQELESTRSRVRKTETGARKWDALIKKYYNAQAISPELIEAFVDEIRFHVDGSVDIDFKYMNEFEEMFNECERIKKEVA